MARSAKEVTDLTENNEIKVETGRETYARMVKSITSKMSLPAPESPRIIFYEFGARACEEIANPTDDKLREINREMRVLEKLIVDYWDKLLLTKDQSYFRDKAAIDDIKYLELARLFSEFYNAHTKNPQASSQ